MSQSLGNVIVHAVFSTKGREPFIESRIQPELHAYIVGALSALDCPSLQVGGVADHVHLLFRLSRKMAAADLIREIKTSSSKWMKSRSAGRFSWQSDYGAFSLGQSQVRQAVRYIQRQEEHHRAMTFQEEFRGFLKKYEIEYDERYVWD